MLTIMSNWIDTRYAAISLSPTFHIGIWGQGASTRVAFFNDRECGPYHGSIIALTAEDGSMSPPIERSIAFAFIGVYYRYFRWPNSSGSTTPNTTFWTFMMSVWYPALVFAILPTVCLRRRAHRRIRTANENTQGSASLGVTRRRP